MISRLIQKRGALNHFFKVKNRRYHALIKSLNGGCLIKVENDGKIPSENEKDLLRAIPEKLYGGNYIIFTIDPTLYSLNRTNNKLQVITPYTHISAFIAKIHNIERVEVNEKTVLSKVMGENPQIKKDIEISGVGIVEEQDFTVKSAFHYAPTFWKRLMTIQKQVFEKRYFLLISLEQVTDDQEKFIKKIEENVQNFIKKNTLYNRQNDSCAHAILAAYAENIQVYTSLVPQMALQITLKTLLSKNELTHNQIVNIFRKCGLKEVFYEKLLKSENQNDKTFWDNNEHTQKRGLAS